MEPYRILHVLGSLNRGGAETLVMNLYRNINRDKIQFDFIVHTNEHGEYEDEILELGGRIYRIPKYKVFNHHLYKKAWKEFFANHSEYRIIHGHVRSTASIYLHVAKKEKLTTIAHSHSISSGHGIKAIIKNLLQYKIRYIADYFMGCSKQANQWLFGRKIANSNKCIVLKNGIEINKFIFNIDIRNKIRKKLNLSEDDILIGHVGRFSPEKNHQFIIDIYSNLYLNNKNYKLILIGNGKEKDKILNICRRKEIINNIIFLQSIPNVYDYMQAMDIFILPSKYEGLGMALIEAQISSLKCFASNTVPKESKLLDDTEFITLKIAQWVKSIENYKRGIRSTSLTSLAKEYDINKVVEILQNFYLRIEENNNEI